MSDLADLTPYEGNGISSKFALYPLSQTLPLNMILRCRTDFTTDNICDSLIVSNLLLDFISSILLSSDITLPFDSNAKLST